MSRPAKEPSKYNISDRESVKHAHRRSHLRDVANNLEDCENVHKKV